MTIGTEHVGMMKHTSKIKPGSQSKLHEHTSKIKPDLTKVNF